MLIEKDEEINYIKFDCLELQSKNQEIIAQNEKLKKKQDLLARKLATTPMIPYIRYERQHFDKTIDQHTCICNICGCDLVKPEKKEETVVASENKIEAQQVSENEQTLKIEIDMLTRDKNTLLETIENMKLDLVVSEERFIKSKPFEYLVLQAEEMMKQLDHLRDINTKLQKDRIELLQVRENEISEIEVLLLLRSES
jgi:hypothetical protein